MSLPRLASKWCLSEQLGRFEARCACRWCVLKREAEWNYRQSVIAETDGITVPYDPNVTRMLVVECRR